VNLTRREGQALAVIASRLDRRPSRRVVTRDDVLEMFRHLGTIQLDTISVISRSHETVLWSRLGSYDTALVTDLYERDHAITEYMVHAAAILPADLLPLFRPAMEAIRKDDGRWLAEDGNRAVANAITQRITTDGPMTSRDFESPPGAVRPEAWEWWGNKPERRVLSHLWMHGELFIHKRDSGFARHFDLAGRVVPGFWDGEAIDPRTAKREILLHAIRALGVTTARWAADYFRTGGWAHVRLAEVRQLMPDLAAEGLVIPVEIPGVEEPAWMDPSLVERLALLRERRGWPVLTTFLSPFDNLTWNRRRGEELWDFDYRLECYVPAPKRIYGYYTMPILHRGAIVGRLDPSFNRRAGVLTINAIHLEPGVRVGESLVRAIVRAIEDLLRFLGGKPGAWTILSTNPTDLMPMLRPYGDIGRQAAD
jgi:uncharacterized protein